MPGWAIALIVSTAAGLAFHAALPHLLRWRGVSLYRRTMAGPALVFDSQDDDGTAVRLLNVAGTFQSICYVDPELRDELVCVYHRTMAERIGQLDRPARALVIGGGGCSLPKWMLAHEPQMHVDVAEIDPKVLDIARERLFLDDVEREHGPAGDGRLEISVCDGWRMLLDAEPESYDVIVNDAFSGKRPIGKLDGEDGARELWQRLREGGLYLANLRSPLEGTAAEAMHETVGAYERVFGNAELVEEAPEEPRRLGNNVLIARKG